MHVETVNDTRASMAAELAAELEAPSQQEAPVEAAEETEIPEGEGSEDNGDGPETATEAEAEDEGDTDEETDEPETVVDPPHFWSKEEKERFAALPHEDQVLVKAKFDENERFVNQQKQEAAEAKKAAVKEAEALSEIGKRVEAAALTAESRFADKWEGATPAWWAQLAREKPDQYVMLKAEHDADQDATRQATAAREATERVERERWATEQGEILRTLVPDLTGPNGKKVGDDIKSYLLSSGAQESDLSDLSALAWKMAYNSMRYERAQAPKPIVKKPAASALPSKSAPPPRATVQQAERKAVENKAYGSDGQRPDRAAMAALLIQDGYV